MEVYPLIVTADWSNRDQCAHRVLVPHEHEISPLLTYGVMNDGRPQYLTNKGMKKHRMRMDSLELESIDRLRFRKERAGWEPETAMDGTLKYYAKDGDCLTASEIADQRTLKDIQALMGEERIFVAIPVQECLYAGSDRRIIEQLCRKRFANAGKAGETALVPHVYEVRDGQIVKLYSADASKPKKRGKGTTTASRKGKISIPAGTKSGSRSGRASSTALRRDKTGTARTSRSTRTHVGIAVNIPKSSSATKTRTIAASSGDNNTFTRIPSSTIPSATPALKLPPKLWRSVLALHAMAILCLAGSIGGLVAMVRAALGTDGVTSQVVILVVVIPLCWLLAWGCWQTVRYLKLGSPLAFRTAAALIGISCLGPLLPLGVLGITGLIDPDTKGFCGIGLWENA